MSTAKQIVKKIKDEGIKNLDFRFTDPRGRLHHITQYHTAVDETILNEGIYIDGSSIAGWKSIHESDMLLKPDLNCVHIDPFAAQPTLTVFCDVYEPSTKKPYERDPRSIAKAAEAYIKKSGVADTAYFGPELEFFIFDDVRISTAQNHVSFFVDSEEFPQNSNTQYDEGNMGHRPGPKGGYMPVQPIDQLHDLRAEMLDILHEVGVECEKHHHEVAPSQCEMGIKYATLLKSADNIQLYKYVTHNTAHAFGKTATFLPKPFFGDNGSGMHTHQSLWKNGKTLFAGKEAEGLSKEALYYIGGIIKHAKAINAFTNASTNSYKRLVPGYEAPVLLAYSGRNRSASCRIPYASSPNGKRVEVRFPDPSANPYLAFAAMLMAGLDGVLNKIHPGDAMNENLYELSEAKQKKIPHVAASLREALEALEADHKFLLKNDVFSKDFIDSYIALKMEEVKRVEMTPHPVEYELYYSI